MIRLALGFVVVYGAVGRLDTDPSASLISYAIVGLFGLALMWWPIADGSIEEYK